MTRGQRVAGGDRLGKTIIFAKNQPHAEFIAQRFDANYPHFKGEFARVIHCNLPYAQSLIDAFSNPAKAPHVAISVDMLDTGIDVPEVLNLVFFKLVRSKTKFWQMVGRGTRLCPDVFGPGKDKEFFYIFDYCQNLEFFSHNPETTEGALGASLAKRLFTARLELIAELDKPDLCGELAVQQLSTTNTDLRNETAAVLHAEVAAMNMENFVIRPRRRLVEKYGARDAWTTLSADALGELTREVAGLPSEIETDDEEAKRFDLLILNLQLAMLRSEPGFTRLRDQVKAIAGLLEEKSAIPMVAEQMVLIQECQTDEWWQDVTIPMIECFRVGGGQLSRVFAMAQKRVGHGRRRLAPILRHALENDGHREPQPGTSGLLLERFIEEHVCEQVVARVEVDLCLLAYADDLPSADLLPPATRADGGSAEATTRNWRTKLANTPVSVGHN